jgi:hypothetical protein
MGELKHLSKAADAALCAVALAALLGACSTEIDREFGPSALQGTGELPGRVITVSPPTGV